MITNKASHMRIAVVDFGAGNLRSVAKALDKIGFVVSITSDPDDFKNSDGIVFPGQGIASHAMNSLKTKGLDSALRDYVLSGGPFFGVCLGLQLMFESSDEENTQCLGILNGGNSKFGSDFKVPHMGWNNVEMIKHHYAFKDIPDKFQFYFVHSYYAVPSDSSLVVGETVYSNKFPSIVADNNILATQFHPEKSTEVGISIYKNFFLGAKERQN